MHHQYRPKVASGITPSAQCRGLTADHRPGIDGPKRPGVVRVGIAPFANKTGQNVATRELADALSEWLLENAADVVLLRSASPGEIEAEARDRSCDLILQTTIAELKGPGSKGMMGKLAGSPSDGLTAKLDFTPEPGSFSTEDDALRSVIGKEAEAVAAQIKKP